MSTPIENCEKDLISCIRVGDVPCLWGPPGTGKTSLIHAIGRKLNLPTYVLYGSIMDPTDAKGFPYIDMEFTCDSSGQRHKATRFAPLDFLVEIVQQHNGRGLIFLDELSGTMPAVQNMLLRPLMDRVFGDYKLDPLKVAMAAAANPPDQAANGQELAMPMVNRICHLTFPSDEAAAIEWAGAFPTYWGYPPTVGFDGGFVDESHMIRARSVVAAFIARFPGWWHKMPTNSDGGTTGYPTGRSWDWVSRHLGLTLQEKRSPFDAARLFAGRVGAAASQDFLTFLRATDVPDPESVLADPDRYTPAGRVDVDFVVMTGVTAAVAANVTPNRLMGGMIVCNKVAKTKGADGTPMHEFAAVSVGRLAKFCTQKSLEDMCKKYNIKKDASAKYVRDLYQMYKPFESFGRNVFAHLDDKA